MIVQFEGKQHQFPDDATDADIAAALGQLSSSEPSMGLGERALDLAKSGGIGVAKAAIGLAGLPGDIGSLQGLTANAVTGQGQQPAPVAPVGSGGLVEPGLESVGPSPRFGLPTSQGIQGAIESFTWPFYKPKTTAGEYARTAGEFLPGLLAGPGGLVRRGLSQVLAPAVTSETAGQATKGTEAEPYAQAAGGFAAPFALAAGRRAITPLPMAPGRADAVQALRNEGVDLTAGQVTGSKPLQWFEQALGDIPGSGGRAAATATRSAEQFTAAALRRAGENAPRATPEVIDRAFTRIGNDFDTLAARNTLRPDPQMGQELRTAIGDYRSLVSPPNRAPVIENFEAEIATALGNNRGVIPGEVYQSLRSRIERAARGAAAQPEVADTLRDMRMALDAAMERTLARTVSPDLGAWRQARNQYRNMLVIERAATGAGENAAQGLISPSQLRNTTVGMGRRAYARGQGDFAELARSGEAVMRSLPQSGTAPRAYAQGIPAAAAATLGAFFGGAPGAAMGGLAALAGPPLAGRALMSGPVQSYLGNQLLPGATQNLLRSGLLGGLLGSAGSRGLLSIQ
jgi:hypothetical protein